MNYSQIAMLWCLLALWCVVRFLAERRVAWLLGAGLGAGLTLVTKHNLGAMIGAIAAAALSSWTGGPADDACLDLVAICRAPRG